ncbi:MAG TPA: hypothetical protein VN644_08670 [Pyrinomonadaceae bacterium]|jgi:hypothetical protein|nr:hypothetical protein [Pyrinomonadaceae bacterium]
MPLPVKLQDVIDALEMTADSTLYFLDRRTGEIEMITEEVWSAAEKDNLISEYPEWERELVLKAREIQRTDHFVELPDKFEIDSYKRRDRFCSEHQCFEDMAVEWLEAEEIPFTRGDEIELSAEM